MFDANPPLKTHMLDVGQGHSLYVAEFGNPEGHPVVYLHGGPGGGHSPQWQRYFNPDFYRIVLFDQRGCGESLPTSNLEGNTIENLVSDIEKIRTHLGIETWSVGGGSWGSSLAMLYAEKHPERVEHLILRGVFFATPAGAAHIAEENGAQPMIDGLFESYRDHIPVDVRSRHGLIRAYDDLMKSGDIAAQKRAAELFMLWDTSIAFHNPKDAIPALDAIRKNPETEIPITKIFMHYSLNEFDPDFERRLLNVPAFHKIPMDIIHGEDDRICPVGNAFKLATAYPHAKFHVCKNTGHSGGELPIALAHVRASEEMRRVLGG